MATLVTALASCVLITQVTALSLTQVTVPPFGLGGDEADLGCEYDTQVKLESLKSFDRIRFIFNHKQGEQVYSVKWYKGGLEIFRFIPSNSPAIAIFPR